MLLTILPIDLLHDILLMLENRKTLAAFISTSHQLNDVFKSHPNSILRQVVCNEVGMDVQVFPYACAALECLNQYEPKLDMPTRSLVTSKFEDFLANSITSTYVAELINLDVLVRELAKSYSIRFKEGRILRNTLTAQESRRFHTAAYLFSQYRAIWKGTQGSCESDSDDESEDSSLKDANTVATCNSFLASLSTEELFLMQEFRDFILQDIQAVLSFHFSAINLNYAIVCAYPVGTQGFTLDQWHHHLLSTTLEYFQRWEAALADPIYAPTPLERNGLWLTDALAQIMRERGIKKPKANDTSKILDNRGTLISACERCGRASQAPFKIFNETNLGEAADAWDIYRLPEWLPRNPIEKRRIQKRIHGDGAQPLPGTAKSQKLSVMRDIMEHAKARATSLLENGQSENGLVLSDDEDGTGEGAEPEDQNAERTPETYKWSPGDVLCAVCFFENFKGMYYAWWLDERQTDRVEAHAFTEQCWWGYECHTQRGYDHASRLDHCCPRTKGIIS